MQRRAQHLLDALVPLSTTAGQIIAQVRDAYEEAHAASAVAATLHPLFQRALAVRLGRVNLVPLSRRRPLSLEAGVADSSGFRSLQLNNRRPV